MAVPTLHLISTLPREVLACLDCKHAEIFHNNFETNIYCSDENNHDITTLPSFCPRYVLNKNANKQCDVV